MSWRIALRHSSRYCYAEPVIASYNEARITPLTFGGQVVVRSDLQVTPATSLFRYRDYFGTEVVAFDVTDAHTELVVVGSAIVETASSRPVPSGLEWADLEEATASGRYVEYLRPSAYTSVPEEDEEGAELRGLHLELDRATAELRRSDSPLAAVHAVSEWIRAEMVYELGVTAVSTSALEAYGARRGVCQDFAHLGILMLRQMGIPCRYVSGYLHPSSEGEIGVTLFGAGHAWLEAWVGAWHAVDPTHGEAVGDRYVTVARGRDYADVAPFRGVFQGGALERLEVGVELTRLA